MTGRNLFRQNKRKGESTLGVRKAKVHYIELLKRCVSRDVHHLRTIAMVQQSIMLQTSK